MQKSQLAWMLLAICSTLSVHADDKTAVTVYHVTGHVLQKVENGYLVESTHRIGGVSGISFSNGKGQFVDGIPAEGGYIPYLPSGTVLVISKQDLVDGDHVEMNIIYGGTFSYANTLGAQATVRKYVEVALPATDPAKEKPFNPGSINDPLH